MRATSFRKLAGWQCRFPAGGDEIGELQEGRALFADRPDILREFKVKGKLQEDEDKLSLRLRIMQAESECSLAYRLPSFQLMSTLYTLDLPEASLPIFETALHFHAAGLR